MQRTAVRALGPVAATGLALVTLPALAQPAAAVSTTVVISEVYGGGGNSGAPYSSDFIELHNLGSSSVSLAGWSVQYASASGTSWTATALSGSIAAGGTYLVKEYTGTTGSALPTPNATGSTNMSATAGKVALVGSTTALSCGSSCAGTSAVKDFIGYGSANDSEGSPAPAPSNTTSDQRAGADTDANSTDFATGAPTPGTSSGGGGGGGGTCSGTQIHTIQRAAQTGATGSVSGVGGIVTAKTSTGFFMQEPDACADSNAATSEGIFVNGTTTAAVGTAVTVSGTVAEVRPGGTSTNLSTTQINSPTVTAGATGQTLPSATLVGSGGRVPPSKVIEDDASGSVDSETSFDPSSDGIDFWESLEGMRVTLASPQVVGPTNSYGETPVVAQGAGTRSNRGGIVAQSGDFNPERVILGTELSGGVSAQVGDTFSADITGILDYDYGNFMLEPLTKPTVVSGGLTPETTTAPTAGQLSTATFNVENLAPTDAASKFSGLAGQIVTNLKSPDLISLEEVQDNDGATDDGVVAADQTLAKLISAIKTAGGPTYTYAEIDPQNDQDGGEPGGNIRCVFLYRTDRGLAFVKKGTPTATTNATITGTGSSTHLTVSPARISPTNSAWSATRKPMVGEFTWNGSTFFAIANHFSSKGGDDPLFGETQPPVESSATKRHSQASLVRTFVDTLLSADPNAKVVVMGDLNDFDFSQTADLLVGSGSTALNDLPRTLPVAERYTYDYEGNSEVLDHILLSPSLTSYSYDVVHINAEFKSQMSDHDPSVVRLTF